MSVNNALNASSMLIRLKEAQRSRQDQGTQQGLGMIGTGIDGAMKRNDADNERAALQQLLSQVQSGGAPAAGGAPASPGPHRVGMGGTAGLPSAPPAQSSPIPDNLPAAALMQQIKLAQEQRAAQQKAQALQSSKIALESHKDRLGTASAEGEAKRRQLEALMKHDNTLARDEIKAGRELRANETDRRFEREENRADRSGRAAIAVMNDKTRIRIAEASARARAGQASPQDAAFLADVLQRVSPDFDGATAGVSPEALGKGITALGQSERESGKDDRSAAGLAARAEDAKSRRLESGIKMLLAIRKSTGGFKERATPTTRDDVRDARTVGVGGINSRIEEANELVRDLGPRVIDGFDGMSPEEQKRQIDMFISTLMEEPGE